VEKLKKKMAKNLKFSTENTVLLTSDPKLHAYKYEVYAS